MNDIFHFHKKDKLSYEINKEILNRIEMSIESSNNVTSIDENQSGYEDDRWLSKSNEIKERDNFTCQLCHTFNPMQDRSNIVYVKQGNFDTYHRYYWAGDNYYDIYVRGFILTITFHFLYPFHLVMPRLNVHHKIYYRNRDLWNYHEDELVTLCEDCHHYIHSLKEIGIPIVEDDAKGNSILIGRTQPKTYNPKLDHTDLNTFKPFAIVKENLWGDNLRGQELIDFKRAKLEKKQWYDYQEILDNKVVNISYFTAKSPRGNNHTDEEIKETADFIIKDFIENILGFTKK